MGEEVCEEGGAGGTDREGCGGTPSEGVDSLQAAFPRWWECG